MSALTVNDVARDEGCSPDTVRRAIRAGHLKARVLNPDARRPQYRIEADAVSAWREQREARPIVEPEPARPVELVPPPPHGLDGLGFTGVVHVPRRRGRKAA